MVALVGLQFVIVVFSDHTHVISAAVSVIKRLEPRESFILYAIKCQFSH